jgi:hypothetical protein
MFFIESDRGRKIVFRVEVEPFVTLGLGVHMQVIEKEPGDTLAAGFGPHVEAFDFS